MECGELESTLATADEDEVEGGIEIEAAEEQEDPSQVEVQTVAEINEAETEPGMSEAEACRTQAEPGVEETEPGIAEPQALCITESNSCIPEGGAIISVSDEQAAEEVNMAPLLEQEVALNGQQLIIVAPQDLQGYTATSDVDVGEPLAKRVCIEGENGQAFVRVEQDGQTYMLAVTPAECKDLGINVPGLTDGVIVEGGSEQQEGTEAQTLYSIETGQLQEISEGQIQDKLQINAADSESGGRMDVTQAWFTTKDDKSALQHKGYNWKQGQWSREEVEILQNNISDYCQEQGIGDPTEVIFEMSKDERKDFYRTVARGLQRPLFSVYRRVIRMYDQRNHIGKYTPEELDNLKMLRQKHGTDWATIGAALGRSASSVKDRCRLMKDTCKTGKWFPDEEKRLSVAVYELSGAQPGDSVTGGLSWSLVAEKVGTRSEKQCRTKWLNYLNWKHRGGTDWTRDDDITLVSKIIQSGVTEESRIDWADLAKEWASARSPQWLRAKWWSLKRHVPDYQMLPFTTVLEQLRNLHSQSFHVKSSQSSGLNTNLTSIQSLPALQPLSFMQNMTLTVPVKVAPGEEVGVPSLNTSTITNGEQHADAATLQAYEVLQQLTPVSTPQGAFLIAPNGQASAAFSTGQIGQDHIIVHTLPVGQLAGNENVAVQMNPQSQVIISTAAGQEHMAGATLQLQDGTLGHVIQEQIINAHDIGEQIIGEGTMVGLPLQAAISQEGMIEGQTIKEQIDDDDDDINEHGMTNTIIVEDAVGNAAEENHTIVEDTLEENAVTEHVITEHEPQELEHLEAAQQITPQEAVTQDDLDDQGQGHDLNAGYEVITEVADGVVGTHELEGGVAVSGGLILVTTTSPSFVQTNSNDSDLIHMSSFSDPMLTSHASDLMGSTSDMESEKVVVATDADAENDAEDEDSPHS